MHAVVAPIVPQGPSVSIRFPDRGAPDLDVRARLGMCPAPWVPLLRLLVQGRANVLITGGTGVGKTTLLKALLACCAPEERIVTVEEVRELLAVAHAHPVSRVAGGLIALGLLAGLEPRATAMLADGAFDVLLHLERGSQCRRIAQIGMVQCVDGRLCGRVVAQWSGTGELHAVPHAHTVSLVARAANVEGKGAVGLPDLVKATLRMRPDRVVVGECRGEEVADLLRALNSGHRGSFTTVHADSVSRVPGRRCGR